MLREYGIQFDFALRICWHKNHWKSITEYGNKKSQTNHQTSPRLNINQKATIGANLGLKNPNFGPNSMSSV